ncbi:MAG: NUDIX domain-containing protein [Candidatus Micrarchaeota archaeon]|nr:NUDIX domain-containing protein [Candidatus Micrarchaeota archaeon]
MPIATSDETLSFRGVPIRDIVLRLKSTLPRRYNGTIEFKDSGLATIVNVVVMRKGRILLMKRSNRVGTYRGKWHSVAGYLDEPVPVRQKMLEELREEIGIGPRHVESLRLGKPYSFYDRELGKRWITCLGRADIKTDRITPDWESVDYRWVYPGQLKGFDLVPKFGYAVRKAMEL